MTIATGALLRRISLLLIAVAPALAACHDTLYYGEGTAFDLAIKLNDNPQSPIEANAGLKRRVLEVAPPISTTQDEGIGNDKPVGEAASSFSGFKLQYDEGDSIFGTLRIRTQFATGQAAADLSTEPAAVAAVVKADFVSKPEFVEPENIDRTGAILAKIPALDDATAVQFACNPPFEGPEVAKMDDLKMPDQFCAPGVVPTVASVRKAKALLRIRIQEDERTPEAYAAWETAFGITPAG